MNDLNVFIGLDSSHKIAYDVCRFSIISNTNLKINVFPINRYNVPVYNRPIDKTESTDFSFARFFVPYCSDFKGVSIFVDGDFLFLKDIKNLIDLFDDRFAIMCCKHNYIPTQKFKMDGKIQTIFPKKNWSSLMIFNNSHPKLRTLNPDTINCQSGAFLHQFKFLDEDEVGSIPVEWNWLVGWYKESSEFYPKALHFTEGGPWLEQYKNVEYSDVFNTYKTQYEKLSNG